MLGTGICHVYDPGYLVPGKAREIPGYVWSFQDQGLPAPATRKPPDGRPLTHLISIIAVPSM